MTLGDALPDSRCREIKGAVQKNGVWYVPIFCANCGTPGGGVSENTTAVTYLCNSCVGKHGKIAHTMLLPDELAVKAGELMQLEEYGRLLSAQEAHRELDDVNSPLSVFARGVKNGRLT